MYVGIRNGDTKDESNGSPAMMCLAMVKRIGRRSDNTDGP